MTYIILILSVILGASIVMLIKLKDSFVKLFLSFSGAYLLSITILHLLPQVYQSDNQYIGLYILLGILIQLFLEYFSKGAEHGHIHKNMIEKSFPWMLFLSLCIHAFFEGIPIAKAQDNTLLGAIIIHNIPISAVLATFLLKSNLSKLNTSLFISIFALMSPFGYLVCGYFEIFETYKVPITAIVVGIFLHISTIILFESSEDHKFNLKKFIVIGFGFLIAFITN